MANSVIQIKRSTTNAAPTGLASGEQAYTANGEVLFVGSPNGNGLSIAIGGRRFPGVLTANQALVANSTSGIDKVIVANLVPTFVTANGALGGTGQILTSNSTGGVYWGAAPSGVTDLTESANATTVSIFSSTGTDAVIDGANSTVAGVMTAADKTKLDGIASGAQPGTVTSVAGGNGLTGSITTSGSLDVGAGNGITVAADSVAVNANSGLLANSTGVFVVANSGLIANATGVFVNANSGIVANSTGVFVNANSTGGLVANATGLHVSAGSGLLTNATGLHVGSGNGISVSADALAVTGGSTITVNATGVHVNTANLSIATSQLTGDIALGTNTSGNYVATITAGAGISGSSTTEGGTPTIAVVANNGIVANSTGVFVNANSGLLANSTGVFVKTGTGVTIDGNGNVAIGQAVSTTSDVTFNNITASGNLVVNGTLVTLDVETLQVEDPLIALARLNTAADSVDIGLYGTYNDGTTRYSGVFRDASNNDIWTFFGNTTVVPTTTVDTAGVGYSLAGILAGTGQFTSGLTLPFLANNGVLIGQNTSSVAAVTSTTEGHVLQISAAGVPTFGMLDGGTF